MSANKELAEALLDERPEGYDAFIDQDGRKDLVNIAGAHIAKHSLGHNVITAFAEVVSERDVYAGNTDIEHNIKETSIKAKVYDKIVDEFEDESDAASKVHYNSTGGSLANMQLREQYGIDTTEASGERFHNWRELTDLEISEEDIILGHGQTAHTLLRYADSRESINREDASDAIDEYIDRGDIQFNLRLRNLQSMIADELGRDTEGIGSLDFYEWRKNN